MADQHTDSENVSIELLIAAGQLIRRVTREAFAGDSAATWRALSVVDQYPGITIGTFATGYGCSQPVATRLVGKLVDEALVRRQPGEDARVTHLYLTDKGHEHLANNRKSAADYLSPGFKWLSDEDIAAVRRTVEIIDRSLNNHDSNL
ncbi:MarR family winged helix-turn-helix transcriptional regulator [Corynebacterium aquilae]|uniref:MarR family winged helix-turn-helix transcriptional regulator n=1 Tax=Corynebacterium aquilae TaxID=203263 RepID=UPI000951069C|nr:MarR family winged helix-turn-helix transcriptional regulator [Corynebacterium aquilae]